MKKFAFAAILLSIGIASSCSKKITPSSTASAMPDGVNLFAKHCARCHGKQGVKDERTPNLQTIALDKGGLVNSITKGKGNMPAFEGKLSEAEIAAVSDLIIGWH